MNAWLCWLRFSTSKLETLASFVCVCGCVYVCVCVRVCHWLFTFLCIWLPMNSTSRASDRARTYLNVNFDELSGRMEVNERLTGQKLKKSALGGGKWFF